MGCAYSSPPEEPVPPPRSVQMCGQPMGRVHPLPKGERLPGLGSGGLLLVEPLGGCYQDYFLELARSCPQARRAARERHRVIVQHGVL